MSAPHPRDYTDCWSDDERMNFFFSAFPLKQSDNPHHWDTKMKFWVDLILDMTENIPCAYITWENLFSKLHRNGKEPLGLHTVFISLTNSGDLVPLNQHMQDILSDRTWIGWGVKWCVKKPTSWVVDKVLSPVKGSPNKVPRAGKFISPNALDKKCRILFSRLNEYVLQHKAHQYQFLNIVSYKKVCEIASDFLCNQESIDIVLEIMKCKNTIEIWPPSGHSQIEDNALPKEKYVKFSKSFHNKVMPFSDADIGIVRLAETKSIIEQQILDISAQISQSVEKAKSCLKDKHRESAKNALRRKKKLESTLLAKEKVLDAHVEILERLQQCKTDNMVLQTYKSAIAAYDELSAGLTLEEVDKTMDGVTSMLENQSKISNALSEPAECGSSMAELEQELAKLVKTDENDLFDELCHKFQNTNLGEIFPVVPTNIPNSPDTVPECQAQKIPATVQ